MKNFVLYISIVSLIALIAGCTSWDGAEGSGSTTPFSANFNARAAFRDCISDRRTQRSGLLHDAGIGTEAATTEIRVSYRDSVQLICTQSDRREAARESRTITREECNRLLAPDGIPTEATGTVRTESPAPTVNPNLQALMAANPALFTDDHAACIANSRGYGVPYTGGMAIGGAQVVGGVSGVPMIAGGVGIMPGVFGLTPVTRNLELDARGMRTGMVAVVTITSVAASGTGNIAPTSPGTLTVSELSGLTPIRVLIGYDYQVLIQCQANGITLRSTTQTSSFSAPDAPNKRVQVNSVCGRG